MITKMTNILPAIGALGKYELKEPYNILIQPDLEYICIALRKLEEIILTGKNPQALYYTPYGVDETIYFDDLDNGVSIITLKASTGELIYFPNSYLLSFPDIGGIHYENLGLGVNLGPLPSNTDLTYLQTKVSELVHDTIGIDPVIKTLVLSGVTMLSQTTHDALTAAREANIVEDETDRAKVIRLTSEVQMYQEKLTALENFVLENKDKLES